MSTVAKGAIESQPTPELRNEASRRFSTVVDSMTNPDIKSWNFDEFLAKASIEKTQLNKAGSLVVTLWVLFLMGIRSKCGIKMKYETAEAFLNVYDGRFVHYAPEYVATLRETANWMNVLFGFIPAEKNKGLALAIIPQVVEGWGAKYVTGSGQTQGTTDRVIIYEKESGLPGVPKRRKVAAVREPSPVSASRRPKTHEGKPNLQVTIPDNRSQHLRRPRAVSVTISPTEVVRKRKSIEHTNPEVVKSLQEEVKLLSHQVLSLSKELKTLKSATKSTQMTMQRDLDILRETNMKLQVHEDQLSRTIADLMASSTSIGVSAADNLSLSIPSGSNNFFNGQLFSAEELMQPPSRSSSQKESSRRDNNGIATEGGSLSGKWFTGTMDKGGIQPARLEPGVVISAPLTTSLNPEAMSVVLA
jgi:hypothetical protein